MIEKSCLDLLPYEACMLGVMIQFKGCPLWNQNFWGFLLFLSKSCLYYRLEEDCLDIHRLRCWILVRALVLLCGEDIFIRFCFLLVMGQRKYIWFLTAVFELHGAGHCVKFGHGLWKELIWQSHHSLCSVPVRAL